MSIPKFSGRGPVSPTTGNATWMVQLPRGTFLFPSLLLDIDFRHVIFFPLRRCANKVMESENCHALSGFLYYTGYLQHFSDKVGMRPQSVIERRPSLPPLLFATAVPCVGPSSLTSFSRTLFPCCCTLPPSHEPLWRRPSGPRPKAVFSGSPAACVPKGQSG